MVSSHALLEITAIVVFLNFGRHASATLFNFSDAARDWRDGWGRTPSNEASTNVQLILSNQNRADSVGRILLDSINQNQSYAVAEAVRFALLPNSDYNSYDPANAPTYNMLAAAIGAATAYAMHNTALLAYTYGAAAPAPATAGGPIMRGGPYPPVTVQPNASDIFYAVALGAVQSVGSSCDARWRCHSTDCNTPQAVVNKRVNSCCSAVSPLMRALNRQLTIFGDTNLLGDALSPAVTVTDNYNLGFLERCIWETASDYPVTAADVPASCNTNRSANYMGAVVRMDVNSQTPGAPIVATAADCCAACVADVQCNVWVFCGSTYGCPGCDYKSINYNAALGSDLSKRFGPYSSGCSLPTTSTGSNFPSGTCTLKYSTFTDVPPAYNNPAASSFVSGYLKQHCPRCN